MSVSPRSSSVCTVVLVALQGKHQGGEVEKVLNYDTQEGKP